MILSANSKLPNMPKNINITSISSKFCNSDKQALDGLRREATKLHAIGVIDVQGYVDSNHHAQAVGVAVTKA